MSEMDKPKKHYFNYQLLYRRTALIIYDILSITAASFLALLLRYDMHVDAIPDEFILPVRNFLPLNILLTLAIFYFFRLYHPDINLKILFSEINRTDPLCCLFQFRIWDYQQYTEHLIHPFFSY